MLRVWAGAACQECARTCTVTWPFTQASFSLLRNPLLFDTVHHFLVVLEQVCLHAPAQESCGFPSFLGASVQQFLDQTNSPENLNYKQILPHRSLQILLTGNPLQTSCEEINPPDWSAVRMLQLSRLRPHLIWKFALSRCHERAQARSLTAAAVAPCKQRNVLYLCSAALLQAVWGGVRKWEQLGSELPYQLPSFLPVL